MYHSVLNGYMFSRQADLEESSKSLLITWRSFMKYSSKLSRVHNRVELFIWICYCATSAVGNMHSKAIKKGVAHGSRNRYNLF